MNKKKEKLLCVLQDDNSKFFKFNSSKPFAEKVLNDSYARFAKIGAKHKTKVIYAKYTNYKRGFVNSYWYFDEKWKKSREKIKPDLFFDKFNLEKGMKLKKSLSKQRKLINDYELEIFCKDKLLQAQKFKKLVPKTILVKNKKDLKKAVKNIGGEKIILKPRFGHGGFGIKIYNINKPITKIRFSTTYIAQKFIDTSQGVPDLKIKGIHDLRSIIVNGKIVYSYVRMPKSGLLANLHQGGKAIHVKIPNKVNQIIKEIDNCMKKFGNRVYSADFFFSNGKYYLVELNSKPGFDACGKYGFEKEEDKFFKIFFKEIIKNY